jgi:hypothetical protein
MRFLAVMALIAVLFACGVLRGHAEDNTAPKSPPASPSVSRDFSLDVKTDITRNSADMQSGIPQMRKEPLIPFLGLSISRPLDYRN